VSCACVVGPKRLGSEVSSNRSIHTRTLNKIQSTLSLNSLETSINNEIKIH